LQQRGYRLLLPGESCYSSVLTSFVVPTRLEYDRLESDLKRAGYVIYAGQGSFRDRIFRIAMMGQRSDEEMDALVELFPQVN
jgi:2-aminoethylphosphonate-pyruvate transaminase